MQFSLNMVLMAAAGCLMAVLTYYLLTPFLPPDVVRYLTFGLTFGAMAFVEERFFKKRDHALLRAWIWVALSMAILFVVERIW